MASMRPRATSRRPTSTGEGLGGDALRAEGQDGSDINNARYFRSPDGGISRIEMYLWNTSNPQRDGDFDNGIIAHEVGHGISIRITGGPSTDNCLTNSEQMGEGWSDWFGLIMSIQDGDVGETGRGIGTYALNQPITGPGIRPARYSTDMGVNGFTYGDIGGLAVPHGVGFMWATAVWEMTWNLIDIYGFDPDLIAGTGGNNVALSLIIEALKMQPCSPGFVTGRDAILAADEALYDGANDAPSGKPSPSAASASAPARAAPAAPATRPKPSTSRRASAASSSSKPRRTPSTTSSSSTTPSPSATGRRATTSRTW